MYLCVSGNARDAEETGGSGFVQLAHLGVAGDVEGGPPFLHYQPPLPVCAPKPFRKRLVVCVFICTEQSYKSVQHFVLIKN